jgi:hypothetical protein
MMRAVLLAFLFCAVPAFGQAPVALPAPVVAPGAVAVKSAPVMVTPQAVVQTGPIEVAGSTQTIWLAAISAVVGLLSTVFTGLMAYFVRRLDKQATAATDIAAVGLAKGEKILDIATASHAILNHDRHTLLQAYAVLARRIAVDSKQAADIQAADDADKAVSAHDQGQNWADAAPGRRIGDTPKTL